MTRDADHDTATAPLRVLGVIPARAGSKGVPHKNLAPLRGRPLLAYTAQAARDSQRLSRVVVSTDSDEIAHVAQEYGIEAPFRRPARLAQDDTPMIPVIQHAIESMARRGEQYDAVCTLQPTTPLRRSSDIDGAIELLETTGADSVISYVDVGEKQPARMKWISEGGRVLDPPYAEQTEGQRRQDLPRVYLREGSVYLTRWDVLINGHSLKGNDCRAWIIPPRRACNIDEPFDLWLAERLLEYYANEP